MYNILQMCDFWHICKMQQLYTSMHTGMNQLKKALLLLY